MSVLVIGGGGYVGSLPGKKSYRKKIKVLVLDLFIYGKPEIIFSGYHKSEFLKIIKGDIRDIDLIQNLISRSTILYI